MSSTLEQFLWWLSSHRAPTHHRASGKVRPASCHRTLTAPLFSYLEKPIPAPAYLQYFLHRRHGAQPNEGASCCGHHHPPTARTHWSFRTGTQCILGIPGAERGIGAGQSGHSRGYCERGAARCLPKQLELLRPTRRAHKGLQRRAPVPSSTFAVYGIAAAAAILVHGFIWVT